MDEDGQIDAEELFKVLSVIAQKSLPKLTEQQLRDVISFDLKAVKAQYQEHIEKNPPPTNPKRRSPRKSDRNKLDFEEFRFMLDAKFAFLNKQSSAENSNRTTPKDITNNIHGKHSPSDNIPININKGFARNQRDD